MKLLQCKGYDTADGPRAGRCCWSCLFNGSKGWCSHHTIRRRLLPPLRCPSCGGIQNTHLVCCTLPQWVEHIINVVQRLPCFR